MNCQRCGGILSFLLVTPEGNNYYQCHQGLTKLDEGGVRVGGIHSCDTIHDNTGQIVKAGTRIGYMVEGKRNQFDKYKTLVV